MPDKASFCSEIGGTHHKEEFSDFLLKNNDQGYKPHLHKTTDDTTDHLHIEKFGKFPKPPNYDDSDKNINSDRSPDQFVDIVQEYSNKNNVNKVGNPEVEKV